MDIQLALTAPSVILGSLFLAKHFVAEGPLQTSYMAYGKARLGHPGGLAHAAIHGAGTLVVLFVAYRLGYLQEPALIWQLALLDVIVHYIVDLLTSQLPQQLGWTERLRDEATGAEHRLVTDRRFYWVLVGDQCLHFLTYLVLTTLVLAV